MNNRRSPWRSQQPNHLASAALQSLFRAIGLGDVCASEDEVGRSAGDQNQTQVGFKDS
jgi:hypothetical protein